MRHFRLLTLFINLSKMQHFETTRKKKTVTNSGVVFAYLRAAQVGKHILGVFGAQVGEHTLRRKWANTPSEGSWASWGNRHFSTVWPFLFSFLYNKLELPWHALVLRTFVKTSYSSPRFFETWLRTFIVKFLCPTTSRWKINKNVGVIPAAKGNVVQTT